MTLLSDDRLPILFRFKSRAKWNLPALSSNLPFLGVKSTSAEVVLLPTLDTTFQDDGHFYESLHDWDCTQLCVNPLDVSPPAVVLQEESPSPTSAGNVSSPYQESKIVEDQPNMDLEDFMDLSQYCAGSRVPIGTDELDKSLIEEILLADQNIEICTVPVGQLDTFNQTINPIGASCSQKRAEDDRTEAGFADVTSYADAPTQAAASYVDKTIDTAGRSNDIVNLGDGLCKPTPEQQHQQPYPYIDVRAVMLNPTIMFSEGLDAIDENLVALIDSGDIRLEEVCAEDLVPAPLPPPPQPQRKFAPFDFVSLPAVVKEEAINTPQVIEVAMSLEKDHRDNPFVFATNHIITATVLDVAEAEPSSPVTAIATATIPDLPAFNESDDPESPLPARRRRRRDSDEDYIPPSKKRQPSCSSSSGKTLPALVVQPKVEVVSDSESSDWSGSGEAAQQVRTIRRGRPPKKPQPVIAANYSNTEEDRYRQLRDKNNEASRRSRQNRRVKEQNILMEAQELERRNYKLKIKVEELERVRDSWHQNLKLIFMNKK